MPVSETITLSIIAKDLASGNIGGAIGKIDQLAQKGGLVGSVFQGVGQKFGQMLNPIGLVSDAVGSLTGFLQEGVQSAIEEEASLRRLDTALENNVEGWDGNRDAIDKAIESRMNLGFQDDALRESMIRLVTATGNAEESIRLQGLAMDIARGKNIDLATATDAVVKANMGNVGALRKMGIELDKGTTKTEILNELQKRFGGQAEDYANTTAGAMESAQIAIGEVAEDIGSMLVPVIRDAAIFVRDQLIPALRAVGDVVGELGGHFQGLTEDVTNFFLSAGGFTGTVQEAREMDAVLRDIEEQYGLTHAAQHRLLDVDQWMASGQSAEQYKAKLTDIIRSLGVGEVDYAQRGGAEWARAFMLRGAAPELERAKPELNRAALVAWQGAFQAAQFAREHVVDLARPIGRDVASVLRSNKDDVKTAMQDLLFVMNNPMKVARERARIEGALMSQELADGLASKEDVVRAQAIETKNELLQQWKDLTGETYVYGKDVGQELGEGIDDSSSSATRAAQRVRDAVQRILNSINAPRLLWEHGQRENNPEGRHAGGPVTRGKPYIVGEHGPELFVPGQGGRIVPNRGEYRSSVGGTWGGETYEFHFHYRGMTVPTGSEAQELARKFMPEFIREMRRQKFMPDRGQMLTVMAR